jgi:methionyl-tRNA formyltransferase
MRLAFMGSAEFSVPSLAALLAAGHEVSVVYTQPAKPAGRGQQPHPSPVEVFARHHHIPVRTPTTLRTAEEQAAFAALACDVAVVAAYGLILPPPVLAAPRFGCLNVHASLLPRWRGAAPIQRAILAGDSVTGITIMQMEAGLDTGPILLQAAVPIGRDTTAGALHDELAALGARLIVDALTALSDGSLVPRPQPAEGVTYATKLDREQAHLDFRLSAVELERAVRAFNPWPVAWFRVGDEAVKVWAAEVVAGEGEPGTVLDDALTIACGEGALRPMRLQRPSRAILPTADVLRGFPIPPGSRLS